MYIDLAERDPRLKVSGTVDTISLGQLVRDG